ncbi:protein kinase domain-containing protein [Pseudonocardia sp. GCM10023141]|uniref:protein kinase domain-containing protein n=1 Tax=Pseudonocardia sp. GCM10023141 TaxID=3252653 RepID=UPI00360607D5
MLSDLAAGDPAQLGPFRLLGRLGAGGMGQVFLGRTEAGRLAAVKVVHPHLAGDPQFRARFTREITTAARVRGPGIAAVVGADPDGARPWLATEYVTGAPLDELVEGTGPLPEPAVVAIAARLAEALAALHAAGVVHRDIKPSNVLLAADGPRLIDFGIAHAVDATRITQTGHAIGTPAYMSPEQALGDVTGPASDVFSLASVLTFAATGSGPFGTATSPVVMLLRITDQQPNLARLPTGLRTLLEPCFARQPAARPSSRDLVGRLAPRPGAEAPTMLLSPAARALLTETRDHVAAVATMIPRGAAAAVPAPAPHQPRRRRPWLVVAAALVAVAAVVSGVVLITRPGGGPGTPGPAATSSPAAPATPGEPHQVASLQVGSGPAGVAVAPDGARAYVRNYTGRDVSVIDTAGRSVTATIGVPGSPYGVAVSPDGARLYILQLSGFVSVLDAATSGVLATVPVGEQPQGIVLAPDGSRAYVPNNRGNSVTVIDTASNTVAATVPVGAGPQAAAITPDGRSLWVFSYDAKQLAVLDTASNTVRTTVAMERADHIAFTPDGARAYITGGYSEIVTAYDVAGVTKLGDIGGLDARPVDIASTPSGRYALVLTAGTTAGDNAVRVVDTTSHFVLKVVALDTRPDAMALSRDGRTLYIACTQDNVALVVDTAGYV